MYKKYFIVAVLFVIFLFYLFYIIGTTKIIIHFEDLEPLKQHLPVYYNGFKIGHTTKVYPDKDYKSTMVDTRLVLKKLVLPANTSAVIRRKDKKDYIELEYPDAPYIERLRHKDVIEGHLGVNFEHFLQDQAESGGLDEIKENLNTTVVSLGQTFDAITDLVNEANEILKDARPLIQDSVNNVNITSKNLADSSFEIKTSLQKGYLDKSLYNLQQTSDNLVLTTKNTTGFTEGLNRQSNVLINCLLKNLNIVVCNINKIIIGVGETLSKNFGGLRLFLGKTLS